MNFKINILFKLFMFFLLLNSTLFANISGTVFRDLPVNGTTLNTYGVKDSNELGISGVTVMAYPGGESTITASDGSWSLATVGDVRIEFSNPYSYLEESVSGSVYNSSVRFVTNGSSVDYALHNPDDYSTTATPPYVTNRTQVGSGVGNSNPAIETVQYTDTGLNQLFKTYENVQGTGAIPSKDTTIEEVGTVWGKAFQKDRQRLFTATVLQRHMGFAPNKGAGDIYVLDYNSSSPATFLGSFSLQGITPNNGGSVIDLGSVDRSSGSDYTLNPDPSVPNIDLDAFAKVGTMSYGDIDIDQKGKKLWLINLYQKTLISVDISGDFGSLSTAKVNQYPIESLLNVPSCNNGNLRPWALKIHDGKGYLGAICDASGSQNVADTVAYVLSFSLNNPTTNGFTEELNFSLDYRKDWDSTAKYQWHAWAMNPNDIPDYATSTRQKHPQPILSNLEFDKNGTMYLAFIDRTGMQISLDNNKAYSGDSSTDEKVSTYGELLRACNNSGTYELEGTGSCTQYNFTNSDDTVQEFFFDVGGDGATEHGAGYLALLKGSNQLLHGMIDPSPDGIEVDEDGTGDPAKYWNTMGVNTLSLTTGDIENWYSNINSGDPGYNGKGAGMGDIELLTAPAPIEIGDYVWEDTDGDGIQNSNEFGIANITVKLFEGSTEVGSATTDTNGYYYFGGASDKSMTIGSLKFNTDYQLRIDLATLSPKFPTLQDVDLNQRDSDGDNGILNAGYSTIAYTTGGAGENDHTLDFGFTSLTLGNRVWNDKNRNGIQDYGESGIKGVIVELYNNGTCDGNSIADVNTSYMGQYKFTGLSPSTYCIKLTKPNDWSFTLANAVDSNGDNNDSKDSDVDVTTGLIENIVLTQNDKKEDIGIYHTQCGLGTLGVGNVGDGKDYHDRNSTNADTTLYWNRGGTYGRWDFSTFEALGYCLEHNDSRPAVGDTGTTVLNPRNGLSDARKVYIQRATSALGDLEMIDIVLNEFPTSENMMDLSIQEVIWYYANYNEDLSAVDAQIDEISYYSTSDRVKVKRIMRLIIDRVEGKNGETQYPISDVTWVHTTDTTHQDIVIPSAYILSKPNMLCNEIGDRIWTENDANGVADDAGDDTTAVVEFDVNVTNGNILYSTKTDVNGFYKVLVPSNQDYNVTTGTPDGFKQSAIKVVGTDNDPVSNNNENHDSNGSIVALGTVDNHTIDFGFTTPIAPRYTLGDKVWKDDNKDGVQDVNESGYENITVKLYDNATCTGTEVNSTITDANGLYGFNNLLAGDYCIAFSNLPAGYSISPTTGADEVTNSDANSDGKIENITLNADDSNEDMGIYPPAPRYTLGDKVWKDDNKDGVQDVNELGVSGINVELYSTSDCSGGVLATDTTDENGLYGFNNLLKGVYCVSFSNIPATFVVSPNTGTNDLINSDANSDGKISNILLTNNNLNEDMGIYTEVMEYAYASIGNKVWKDENRDGIQDLNESGMKDITVTLYTSNCTTKISSVKTDVTGHYLFSNLLANTYCLGFEVPNGYAITLQDNPDDIYDSEDSDVSQDTNKTISIKLDLGENDMSWDAGMYELSSIGDFVWYDDIKNGIPDESEIGVTNIEVTLYTDCNTSRRIIQSTTTDSTGHYLFSNLEANDDYCIGFNNLPEGYQFTVDEDSNLSDILECIVDTSTGITENINLAQGENNLVWDMGIIPKCLDEEGRHLEINDDAIVASSVGSVTTIDVLSNDFGNLDIESIQLIKRVDGEILHSTGTAIGGTSIETYDELVVPGEGVWRVTSDGKITFTSQSGFTGVPTPIYYVVKCKQGNISNVAQASITSPCLCETYEEKSVSALSKYGMFLILLLTSILALIFFRKEFDKKFV